MEGNRTMDKFQNGIWENFGVKPQKQNPRALAVNTVLAGKYLVGPVLGEGGFGITYAGYDLNMETRIAIKEYFPVELVTRDTTRRSAGDSGSVSGGSIPSAKGAFVSGNLASASEPSAGGVSSSGGGSDRVISLSGEKSKTYQQGLKKYVDEARNVSQFADIPGIVSVKDFFYENNTAYIVMEYIEGISLKEYLKQKGGKLSEEESLAILRPVLEALEKVHAAGIVHRDISPDNIMLTFAEEGEAETGQSGVVAVYGNISAVKLIDFGAARMTSKNDQKSLTVILKHGYAPEEQYRSHGEQGPWTDVYAICAVLYRMLTGKVPEPAMDRLFSDGLKRPEELGVKITPAVSEAILRGLAVKKEDRIQSVRELVDALDGKRSKEAKTKRKIWGIMAAIAGAIGILAVSGLGLGNLGRGEMGKNIDIPEKDMTVLDTEGQDTGSMAAEENQVEEGKSAEENLILLEEEEEEAIAFRDPQTVIAEDGSVILLCLPDGSVKAYGDNEEGQCEVENWGDVVAVSANVTQSLGLDANGTVYAAGKNTRGECNVGTWKDIVAVEAGFYASFGLCADGTVVACGDTERYDSEIGSWSNIKAISATPGNEYGLAALDTEGKVFCAGFDQELSEVTGWEDVEHIQLDMIGSMLMLVGLREDGTIVCHNLTEGAELQEYDEEYLQWYEQLETWSDMEQISPKAPACGVKKDGTIVFSEDGLIFGYHMQEESRLKLAGWDNMEAVTATYGSGGVLVTGITRDGQIREFRENSGNTELEDMKNLKWVKVLNGGDGSIIAGTQEGQILTYGSDNFMDYMMTMLPQDGAEKWIGMEGRAVLLAEDGSAYGAGYLGQWKEENVKQAVELWNYAVYDTAAYALLLEDGSVKILSVGPGDPALEGTAFTYEGQFEEIKRKAESWTQVKQLAWNEDFLYGLREDGTVVSTSDKELSFTEARQEIRTFIGKERALIALTEEGVIRFLISNADMETSGMEAAERWENVTDFALGGNHVVGLLADGTVTAAGRNYAGQCDVEDWEDIVYVTAGTCCTIGITTDGELKIAGFLY